MVQVLHASDQFCHANFSSLGLLGSKLLPEVILAKQVCDSNHIHYQSSLPGNANLV